MLAATSGFACISSTSWVSAGRALRPETRRGRGSSSIVNIAFSRMMEDISTGEISGCPPSLDSVQTRGPTQQTLLLCDEPFTAHSEWSPLIGLYPHPDQPEYDTPTNRVPIASVHARHLSPPHRTPACICRTEPCGSEIEATGWPAVRFSHQTTQPVNSIYSASGSSVFSSCGLEREGYPVGHHTLGGGNHHQGYQAARHGQMRLRNCPAVPSRPEVQQ